jgi:glycerol uptake facilitator-like aquaporin
MAELAGDCPAFKMKKAFAELLGTFALVFAGTGAIVINQASGGAVMNLKRTVPGLNRANSIPSLSR